MRREGIPELDWDVYVNWHTLLDACGESLGLVEGLNRLVVEDVSHLPARDCGFDVIQCLLLLAWGNYYVFYSACFPFFVSLFL